MTYVCYILYISILVDVSYNWKKVWISENLYDFMILFYEGSTGTGNAYLTARSYISGSSGAAIDGDY